MARLRMLAVDPQPSAFLAVRQRQTQRRPLGRGVAILWRYGNTRKEVVYGGRTLTE